MRSVIAAISVHAAADNVSGGPSLAVGFEFGVLGVGATDGAALRSLHAPSSAADVSPTNWRRDSCRRVGRIQRIDIAIPYHAHPLLQIGIGVPKAAQANAGLRVGPITGACECEGLRAARRLLSPMAMMKLSLAFALCLVGCSAAMNGTSPSDAQSDSPLGGVGAGMAGTTSSPSSSQKMRLHNPYLNPTAVDLNGNGTTDFYLLSDVPYGAGRTDGSGACKDSRQAYDIYLPVGWDQGGALPVLLYTHGGGFTAGDKGLLVGDPDAPESMLLFGCPASGEQPAGACSGTTKFAGALARGYIVVSMDYGFSTCNPVFDTADRPVPVFFGDHRSAVRDLRTNASYINADPNKVIDWGFSSGGTLSVWGALDPGEGIDCAIGKQALLSNDPREVLAVDWAGTELERPNLDAADYEKMHGIFKEGYATDPTGKYVIDSNHDGIYDWQDDASTLSDEWSVMSMSRGLAAGTLDATNKKIFVATPSSPGEWCEFRHRGEGFLFTYYGNQTDSQGHNLGKCESQYSVDCPVPHTEGTFQYFAENRGLVFEMHIGETCANHACSCDGSAFPPQNCMAAARSTDCTAPWDQIEWVRMFTSEAFKFLETNACN
jgi:hypothetical protein